MLVRHGHERARLVAVPAFPLARPQQAEELLVSFAGTDDDGKFEGLARHRAARLKGSVVPAKVIHRKERHVADVPRPVIGVVSHAVRADRARPDDVLPAMSELDGEAITMEEVK